MFRKLTDTLNSTLDNVKSYGSSISFGGAAAATAAAGAGAAQIGGQQRVLPTDSAAAAAAASAAGAQKTGGANSGADAVAATAAANGPRFPISLPTIVVGNGAVAGSANAAAAPGGGGGGGGGGFFALPTLGRRSTTDAVSNPIVMQTAAGRGQRGPALGMGFDTGESRLHKMNGSAGGLDAPGLTSEQRAASYQNIRSYEQYQEATAAGLRKSGSPATSRAQLGAAAAGCTSPSPAAAGRGGSSGAPAAAAAGIRRSDTDELIDTDFAKLKSQLDNVLDVPEDRDDGAAAGAAAAAAVAAEAPAEKSEPSAALGFLRKIIDVIQDDRVKGGCVEAHELVEVTHGRESHFVLKKVLNISFLTLGLLLFAAVIAVIIYTNVATPPEGILHPPTAEPSEDKIIVGDTLNITALGIPSES